MSSIATEAIKVPMQKTLSRLKRRGTTTTATGRRSVERADWLATARVMFIRQGIAAVKVDRIAKVLKVTRGGFYWRFKGRAELLGALLEDWRRHNSAAVLAALMGTGTPAERVRALFKVWIEETDFDPDYDKAIRDWARTSRKAAEALRAVDDERIEALHQLFVDAGLDDREAFIRARVAYYHQVGYYAMGVKEPREQRWQLADLYLKVLTGFP